MNNQIFVETKLGTIIATESTDPNYPGIFIDFQSKNASYARQVCVVEVLEEDDDNLRCLVNPGHYDEEDYSEEFENLESSTGNFLCLDTWGTKTFVTPKVELYEYDKLAK